MADSPRREVAQWDPLFTKRIKDIAGPVVRRYFRAEVRGIEAIPPTGGVLVVSNHSGGMFTPDVLVLATAYYDRFGYERPLYTLTHSMILIGSLGTVLRRAGALEASRGNAAHALTTGAAVLVFPGGDYDAYRPTSKADVIDFYGDRLRPDRLEDENLHRAGRLNRGARDSVVLLRGSWLSQTSPGLDRLRAEIVPFSIGWPFGLGVVAPNIPLPAKIITRSLHPSTS